MNLDKFTLKSQEAITQAQSKAIEYGHPQIDGEHLLLALLEQSEGLFPRLLEKMGVRSGDFYGRLEEELNKLHRVSGGDTEAGKVYVTQRLNSILVQAERKLKS